MLFINKVRGKWNCYFCSKEIPKGSFCVSDDDRKYFKFCFSCAEVQLDKMIEMIKNNSKERIKHMRNLKKKIKKNIDKYNNNNAVAVMQQETI